MAGFVVEYVKLASDQTIMKDMLQGEASLQMHFGDPSCPVVGVLKAKGFAALKASDQTIMKDMLEGKYLSLRGKLLCFEPSQFPTCYKMNRMYLCPLGVILLVNNVVSTNESNIGRWSCPNLRV
ncbi:hypothetical protein SELMODRAFT_431546 [Selaginella moellendorffii]|uniref:Uncharacterized protein n=1 Tax=Selaginella moellendorffii TaxID=88036 RepID=D8TD07_SELML|nr:hypothetical protein SELMODRAFT_431546 [Selaginella moellendorffii]